jgi:peptidoglycan/xylan/chitin deacetylase (PgdA/CDA1 family)
MARLHKTPFKTLLENILDITENHQAGFTFPIVASVASRNPELVRLTTSFHQEIASHGFNHVSYRYLSLEAQKRDIEMSLQTFQNLGIPIRGFRAPYNMYADQTPRILEEFNFLWEAGIGFNPPYCENKGLFRVCIDGRKSNFTCIPIYKWSDDRMIDNYGLDVKQMTKVLKAAIRQTRESHGVIMFDLHPIRIGQPRYIDLLKKILEYGIGLDGWFPIVTEAVEYWQRHQEWKDGASFCSLLSGDIDNFTFFEYLTRLF